MDGWTDWTIIMKISGTLKVGKIYFCGQFGISPWYSFNVMLFTSEKVNGRSDSRMERHTT